MDKRIIILIVIFLTIALGFFLYRKLYYKPEGIHYIIGPSGVIYAGDSIVYNDLTPDARRWKWDFGDDEFSADRSGKHIFLQPGKFNVKLTVYGPFGILKDSLTDVTVLRGHPVLRAPEITGDSVIELNTPETYESSVTADAYEWHVAGDPAFAGLIQHEQSATYTFTRPGSRLIILTTHNPEATVQKKILVNWPRKVKSTYGHKEGNGRKPVDASSSEYD